MDYCKDPIMFLINFTIQHTGFVFIIIILIFLGIIKLIELIKGEDIIPE